MCWASGLSPLELHSAIVATQFSQVRFCMIDNINRLDGWRLGSETCLHFFRLDFESILEEIL